MEYIRCKHFGPGSKWKDKSPPKMGVTVWVNSFIFSQVQGEARFWLESSMISFLSLPFVSRNENSNTERRILARVSSLCPSVSVSVCLVFSFPEMTMQGHACLGRRSVRNLFPSYQFKKPLKKPLRLELPSSTTRRNFSLHALCSKWPLHLPRSNCPKFA